MKLLREYVWDTLRQNKRASLVIMTALFLMTTLMSCFCGFVYTMWTDSIVLEKWHNGDWHGELFDNTPGKALSQIENYASVSAVLIKGKWETALLPDENRTDSRRPYLIYRGANQEYWDSMPEKRSITAGRCPSSENEIVLSKQYFEAFPDMEIGDTITLPVGQRIHDGQACMDTDVYHEDEAFRQTGTKTYTIVGSMDVTTSSAVPAYTGMTWLDNASILPDDLITVYLRFSPVRRTYQELPALAKAIGYETDEYGAYELRYNTGLLSTYGIFAPSEKGFLVHLSLLAVPLMFLIFTVFLIAVFVLVIHNAFVISVNEKLAQLAIFSGVGATPKQIRKTVRLEALLLTSIPLPFGLFAGWLLVSRLFGLINATNDIGRDAPDIVVTYGLPAVLPATLLSLLTAWLSAGIPARRAARKLPIEILKQDMEPDRKKHKKEHKRLHFPGITGELAANAVSARRHSYRMATISLCMSFLLLMVFQYIVTTKEASDAIFRTSPSDNGHIFLSISDGGTPDMEALEQIKAVPGITKSFVRNLLYCATWINPEDTSQDILTGLGGFDGIIKKNKYSPIKRDGKYRIQTVVYGLDQDSFQNYCKELGIPSQPFYEDSSRAIVYNYTKDPEASTRRNILYRELLDIQEQDRLLFTEKNKDEIEGDFKFSLTAWALTNRLPVETLGISNFTLALFMPMEHVLELGAHCCERRENSSRNINCIFWTGDGSEISYPVLKDVSKEMEKTITRYYGSGDYLLSNLAEEEELNQSAQKVISLVITFLTGFLAVIGLSNVWASISGNLRRRRQEFAMLRSVGLSPRQLAGLLFLEGLTLGLKPLLYSLPVQGAVLTALLLVTEVSLPEYLPYAPLWILLAYTLLILLAVTGAYTIGGRRLAKETIITAIRDDTM